MHHRLLNDIRVLKFSATKFSFEVDLQHLVKNLLNDMTCKDSYDSVFNSLCVCVDTGGI